MFQDKLGKFVAKVEDLCKERPAKKDERHKIRLLNLVLIPYGLFSKNFKTFAKLSMVFVVLMSLLAFALGNGFACDEFNNTIFACSTATSVNVVFVLLRLLLIAVFIKAWNRIAIKGDAVNSFDFLVIKAIDWKLFATFLLVIIVNMLPLLSFIILKNSVPNPDWRIESLFFALVSCGFVLPIWIIRFYAIPAYIAGGDKIPSFSLILKNSSGNGLKLLFAFTFVVLVTLFVEVNFIFMLKLLVKNNLWIWGILTDILYNLSFLAMVTILFNFAVALRKEMLEN